MENAELIEINVYNSDKVKQYSFLVNCVMDSQDFRDIVDETLAKGYDGWSCSACRLADKVDDSGLLVC